MTEEEECIDEDSLSRAPYDLDELDLAWLDSVNQKRKFKGQNGACTCKYSIFLRVVLWTGFIHGVFNLISAFFFLLGL